MNHNFQRPQEVWGLFKKFLSYKISKVQASMGATIFTLWTIWILVGYEYSLLAVELFIYCKKIFTRIILAVLITSPIGFGIAFTSAETRLKQSWDHVVYQRCLNFVTTSDTDVVSTLCNVENLTLDFVSYSTSDQHYFNVDPPC